jgi:hypothetical protein
MLFHFAAAAAADDDDDDIDDDIDTAVFSDVIVGAVFVICKC